MYWRWPSNDVRIIHRFGILSTFFSIFCTPTNLLVHPSEFDKYLCRCRSTLMNSVGAFSMTPVGCHPLSGERHRKSLQWGSRKIAWGHIKDGSILTQFGGQNVLVLGREQGSARSQVLRGYTWQGTRGLHVPHTLEYVGCDPGCQWPPGWEYMLGMPGSRNKNMTIKPSKTQGIPEILGLKIRGY